MENLTIDATKSSPFISLNVEKRVLEISGESYPENAAKFYEPMFKSLRDFLDNLDHHPFKVVLSISYFNSSTSKVLMNLLDILEEAYGGGKSIEVFWRYHAENEIAQECGEEFMEDLDDLPFNLVEITD